MYQYRARYQLKNMAKDRLTGKFADIILMLMAVMGIYLGVFLMTSMVSAFAALFQGIFGFLLRNVVSLAFSILVNVVGVGTALYYLNIACGQPFSISNLFYGFREQPNKCLALCSILCCITLALNIPGTVLAEFYGATGELRWLFYSYGLDLACQVLFLPLTLAISQSVYLLLDYPGLSATEILKKSIRLMQGHKKRLFLLHLSFFPLMLLCCLTPLLIGFLWLLPYMEMTYALFFLDLMSPRRVDG